MFRNSFFTYLLIFYISLSECVLILTYQRYADMEVVSAESHEFEEKGEFDKKLIQGIVANSGFKAPLVFMASLSGHSLYQSFQMGAIDIPPER